MSLKTDYYDGPNGFNTKMNDVFVAGQDFVTAQSAILTNELQASAASGLKTFTVKILTTFEPANLRLEGTHMDTYFAGILNQMGTEEIYNYEVTLALNTGDITDTYVDFNFTF